MTTTWHSGLRFNGLLIPAGAERGVEEGLEELGEAEGYLTWNAVPRIRGAIGDLDTNVGITTVEVSDRWGPALRSIKRGQELELYSVRKEGFVIWPGEVTTTLDFWPCPVRRPHSRKPHGFEVLAFAGDTTTLVPVTVDGRTVTLVGGAKAFPVLGQFLPIRPVWLLKKNFGRAVEIEGKQSWGCALLDRFVPEGWTPS